MIQTPSFKFVGSVVLSVLALLLSNWFFFGFVYSGYSHIKMETIIMIMVVFNILMVVGIIAIMMCQNYIEKRNSKDEEINKLLSDHQRA